MAVFVYASLCFPVSVSIYASLYVPMSASISLTATLPLRFYDRCIALCVSVSVSVHNSVSMCLCLCLSLSWEPSMGFGVHLGTPKCHLGNQGRHLVILG